MPDEHPFSPGVVPDAQTFLTSIRKGTGGFPKDSDATAFLEKFFHESMQKIDAEFLPNERRYRAAFFSGALLGARIAARASKMIAEQAMAEARKGEL